MSLVAKFCPHVNFGQMAPAYRALRLEGPTSPFLFPSRYITFANLVAFWVLLATCL